MASFDRSDDNDLLIALRHPLRRRILRRMDDERPISPRELSHQLQVPLSNVSYHVRVLVDCAAVTLVGTQPVRGSMKHFYRSAIDAPWARQVLGISEAEDEAQGEKQDDPEA
ncbi:MAG: helix-turn-helix transcriptional regulator [Actinobacteria bacterium]|nr:helix-turn-helix transcriptional regulator [Actinomycetota bacterium]